MKTCTCCKEEKLEAEFYRISRKRMDWNIVAKYVNPRLLKSEGKEILNERKKYKEKVLKKIMKALELHSESIVWRIEKKSMQNDVKDVNLEKMKLMHEKTNAEKMIRIIFLDVENVIKNIMKRIDLNFYQNGMRIV